MRPALVLTAIVAQYLLYSLVLSIRCEIEMFFLCDLCIVLLEPVLDLVFRNHVLFASQHCTMNIFNSLVHESTKDSGMMTYRSEIQRLKKAVSFSTALIKSNVRSERVFAFEIGLFHLF